MLATVFSGAVYGVDAYKVEIEVNAGRGDPQVVIVGLPDAAVKESRDRVHTAITNSGSFTSIYIGTAGCPAQMIRNIIAHAGLHLYINSDDLLLTDTHYLAINASTPGTKEITLPPNTVLRNILTDQILTPTNNIVQQTLQLGETRQYYIQPAP